MKLVGLASLASATCAHTQALPNIVELAQSVSDLSTLVTAVVAGDLADTLSGPGPFTVFAPTDEAFQTIGDSRRKQFPGDIVEDLLKPANKKVLVDILTNHVVDGEIKVKQFDTYDRKYVKTLSGGSLRLNSGKSYSGNVARACPVYREGSSQEYNQCWLTRRPDNAASNGVVHIIEGVLLPDYGVQTLPNKLASQNIVELAKSVDLTTLVTAVEAADLVDTLTSPGLFTVFAPTNAGFNSLPAGVLESLLKPENKAELVDILTFHVLPSQVASTNLGTTKGKNFALATTVETKPIRYTNTADGIKVGANSDELMSVVSADNFATNGVVHVIDGVLLPSSIATDKKVRLTSYGQSFCRGDVKGSFDINDGECYQLSQVPESGQTEDQRVLCEPNGNAFVLKYRSTDGSCSNEIVSILDARFLVKKDQCLGYGAGIKIDCNPTIPNIVQLAESVSDLSTLVAAVVAGDLVDSLSSVGPFTVFAPTNEGFAALPAGTLDSLMKPENKGELVDILTYHVLEGKFASTDLDLFQEVTTLEGKKLHIQKFGGKVQVGASLLSKDLRQVTSADNLASNGVVHIINGVLLPPVDVVV